MTGMLQKRTVPLYVKFSFSSHAQKQQINNHQRNGTIILPCGLLLQATANTKQQTNRSSRRPSDGRGKTSRRPRVPQALWRPAEPPRTVVTLLRSGAEWEGGNPCQGRQCRQGRQEEVGRATGNGSRWGDLCPGKWIFFSFFSSGAL